MSSSETEYPGELDVCPQCSDEDETVSRYDDADEAPEHAPLLDADAVYVCDGCGFRVREYDGRADF